MNTTITQIIVSALALVTAVVLPVQARAAYVAEHVNCGGGGNAIGLIVHPAVKDLVYLRGDVTGLYRWDATRQRWLDLLEWMPLTWIGMQGCDGLAVDSGAGDDAARQNIVYAALGSVGFSTGGTLDGNGVWRSLDRGETWTQIWNGVEKTGAHSIRYRSFSANGASKKAGECLALDPANPDLLYAGTRNAGLWRSLDARAAKPTFTRLDGAPEGYGHDYSDGIGPRIVFIDPNGGTTGGTGDAVNPLRSKLIYLGLPKPKDAKKNGDFVGGVWRSTDGGVTFARLDGLNAPTHCERIFFGPAGSIFVVDEKKLLQWNGTAWVVRHESGGVRCGDSDPRDRNTVVISADKNYKQFAVSRDGGATWQDHAVDWQSASWAVPGFIYPGMGYLRFDPFRTGALWSCDCFGVDHTDDVFADKIAFRTRRDFYESIVVWKLCSPPVGPRLYVTCADVCGFAFADKLDVAPAEQLGKFMFAKDKIRGSSVVSDVQFAPSAPAFQVGLRGTESGYYTPYPRMYLTRDAGKTWQAAPVPHDRKDRSPGPAKIAISATDPNRAVYLGSYAPPRYTTNLFAEGGAQWLPSRGFEESPNDADPYGVDLMRIVADAVDGQRFFYYPKVSKAGLQVSTDGGATWSAATGFGKLGRPTGATVFLATVRCGNASEFWMSLGRRGLWRSADGAHTFVRVNEADLELVRAFCFGPPLSAGQMPTLFVAGVVSRQSGVFLSSDGGKSFTLMTPEGRPLVGGGEIMDMVADARQPGTVYIGTSGMGVVVVKPAGQEKP
jgi:xyloglucan-specific exo-beta-1,4-glucanase